MVMSKFGDRLIAAALPKHEAEDQAAGERS